MGIRSNPLIVDYGGSLSYLQWIKSFLSENPYHYWPLPSPSSDVGPVACGPHNSYKRERVVIYSNFILFLTREWIA